MYTYTNIFLISIGGQERGREVPELHASQNPKT